MSPALPSTNDVRINARLSGEDAARFRELLETTRLSASELLRTALREYYATHTSPKENSLDLLANFIGSGDGPEDLSVSYKDYLSKALENKLSSCVQEPRATYG